MIPKTSPEWPGAKAWLEQEIERAREAVSSPDCGIKESDLLRGEIRMLRKIIAHVEPAPKDLPVEHPTPSGVSY